MGKIILCGAGGGGKDYMRKILEKQGFKYGISYTTRMPRAGEKEGVDYYFISKEEFETKIKEGFFIEFDPVIDNYYGTAKWQFEEYDLFIMTRSGLNQLTPEDRSRVTIMWINIDEEIRKERMRSGRGWNEQKIEERINYDRKEFEGFEKPQYDIKITNPDF